MKNISHYIEQVKRKVLIVEDEQINQQILSFILEKDYVVLLADNGQEALDLLHDHYKEISLVLLDLVMPVMDGFETLRCIQDEPSLKRIPVIVLTSDKSAEIESLKLGAQDFIVKPYDMPEVILARIKRAIMLAEETNLIINTQKDSLTDLFTKKYFYEYIHEFDILNPSEEMDAVVISIKRFHIFNAHSLKGVCGNLSLTPIYDVLNEIVEPLRIKKEMDYAPLFEKLNKLFEELKTL